MVVVVAHTQFEQPRPAGRLDPAHQPGFDEVGERVVHGLQAGLRDVSEDPLIDVVGARMRRRVERVHDGAP